MTAQGEVAWPGGSTPLEAEVRGGILVRSHLLARASHALVGVALALFSSGCALKSNKPASTQAEADEVQYMKMEDDFSPIEIVPATEPSPYFVKDGKPFCFMGTNNYYLMYKKPEAILSVLDVAQAMNLGVVRMWAFVDRGSLDGTMPNIREPGHQEGIYFQYWDTETNKPAYNDGPDGLQKLDFVLHEARKRGLALTLVLTNNWRDFGGMDQYLLWYGLEKHHEFYTDARVRQAYKDWVTHIVSRTNSIDGTPYKDDPAIFAWELANEPRTINYENFDSPDGWDVTTITKWADEMSAHVKSLDPNHMVAVGDEGFMSRGGNDWAYQTPQGVDTEALASLPNIDFGTYHLYPDHWGMGYRWGNGWIRAHIAASRRVNKPMVLEEYGAHIRREQEREGKIVHGWEKRKLAYENWNNLILHEGGQASMFWILVGMDEGKLYPDYDHFSVYKDDITYELLKSYADRLPTEAAACRFAEGVDHGPPSPFISSRGAPDKKPLAPAAPPAAPAAPAAAPPVPAAAPETAPPPADPPTSRGVSRTAGVPS